MNGLPGWYEIYAVMPPSPGASAIRNALSRLVIDEFSVEHRPQEFLSGFNTQPGGKFAATYVTDNLQHIADAAEEPSITILFVKDMGNGLHLGMHLTETHKDIPVDVNDRSAGVQSVLREPIYTPHPAYEDFMLGGLTKDQAFRVNDMFGVP